MENKIEHWKKIADQWRQSGKTQKEFCIEHEIKFTTFTYWMGRVKKEEMDSSQVKNLVCISMPSSRVTEEDIILEIDRRYRIKLPQGFDSDTLRQILVVIG